MELKILHYLLLITIWVTLTHQLALAEHAVETGSDSCTSSIGPDGDEEKRCTVLWLPVIMK